MPQPKSKPHAISPRDPAATEYAQASQRSRLYTMRLLPAAAAVSILTSLTYLSSRVKSVLALPQLDSITWIVLLVEISTAVPQLFMHLSILLDGIKAAAKRRLPQQKNTDTKLPRVDVFVTHCGEGADIVLNTAKAACAQDFPSSLVRVFILDDSGSSQIEDAVLSLRTSSKYPNLYYASRNIHYSTHSRAANLNFGISFASTLPGPAPEYISVLDVDMIPTPDWLKAVLTSLLHNPTAALVYANQRFYNIPLSDPLGIKHDLAHIESLIYMQNAADGAYCTGSGFVVRSAAVKQIGGFPEGQMQDDVLLTLLLSAASGKTICIPGNLQWGLAPDTMVGWIKQRQRWAMGLISIAKFICSSQGRQISTVVRLTAILWGMVDTYSSFVWTLSMVVLPLAVATGKPLLPQHELRLQLNLAVLDFVAQSMCHYLLSSLLDFRLSMLEHVSAIWTAPLRLVIAYRYIVPSILGRPLPRFKPTGLPTTGDSERAARKKKTSCLRVVLWECGGWMHLLCLGICVAGVGASIGEVVRVFGQATSEKEDLRQSLHTAFNALIVRVGWPPLFMLFIAFIKNAWTPIAYALFPPPLVEMKDMLYEDMDTGALYPTEKIKGEYMKKVSQSFWWSVAAFYLVVSVGSEMSLWHV